MSWMNDIVQTKSTLSHVDDSVEDSLELYSSSESYDEYILRRTCAGVEPLFTRAEFEDRNRMRYFRGRSF